MLGTEKSDLKVVSFQSNLDLAIFAGRMFDYIGRVFENLRKSRYEKSITDHCSQMEVNLNLKSYYGMIIIYS